MKRFGAAILLGAMLVVLIDVAPYARARSATARQAKILIVVYDAGETLGLLPVGPLLAKERIDLRWMPLTPWSTRILEDRQQNYLPPPEGLETMTLVKDREAGADIAFWRGAIADEKPDLVIVGMVSRAQEQLARELKARGVRTVGFYDGFDPTTRASVVARVASQVQTVWAPTATIARNLKALGISHVKVLGQPSVETWYRAAATVDGAEIYDRLQIPRDKKVLLFAGQYGAGYAEIFAAFLRAASIGLELRPDLYLVISHHPKTDGQLELDAMQKLANPRIIMMPSDMTTANVATISRAVVTWRSTVGAQAAFLGKPVLYFNFNRGDYTNDLIRGRVAIAATPLTFGADLRHALQKKVPARSNRYRLLQLGYVLNADRQIADEIRSLVRRARDSH